jgi:hypothetical protein
MKSVAAAVRLRLINEPEGHVFLCQPGLFPEMIQPLLTNDAILRNQEISVAKKMMRIPDDGRFRRLVDRF